MEIKVGEATYRIGKLNAFQQLHIARRIAPLLTSLGAGMSSMSNGIKPNDMVDLIVSGMLAPAAGVLAKMTDSEVEYVLFGCLRVVQRREGDNKWAELCAPTQGDALMYPLDFPELIQLVGAVLKGNLGNFFPRGGATSDNQG